MVSVSAVIAAAVSTLLVYYILKLRNSRFRKFVNQLPGPKKLPFLGNALQLIRLPNEETTQLVQFQWPKIYGPRFTIALGGRHYFITNQPKDIERLLSSSVQINKGVEYKFIHSWLGEGLLTSTGSKWFKRRKMLTPSFHFKILEQFMNVFNQQSDEFVKILQDESGEKKPVEIGEYVTRCTLDIICETAMGRSVHAQRDRNTSYVKAIYELSSILNDRSVNPLLNSEFIWRLSSGGRKEQECLKILHGFTSSVIQERKEEMIRLRRENPTKKLDGTDEGDVFLSGKKRPVAFMDLLLSVQLDNPSEISDSEIREETDTFMFEGHDTTAASLSWTIFLLGCYPEHQEKVYEEMQSIFGNDKTRPVTAQDLTQMKYLECCIKESLRIFPSVPFMSRMLVEDLVLDDSVTIPKDFNFIVFPMVLHRNPELYPDPLEFRPDRFFPENSAGRHPYAYIPFSAGPRNCIGQKFALMEEKVILANLVRNFKINSLEKKEDIILMTELILRSKHGLHATFVPR